MLDNDPQTADGFDREGHLSPLAVERIVAEELGEDGPIGAHLDACGDCRAAVDGARAEVSSLRPPAALREAARGPAAARPAISRNATIGAVVALAAVGLFFALRPAAGPTETLPIPPDIRLKGGFELQIVGRDPAKGTQRPIADGDTVHPGEQLGFKARATKAGHLLILGVDGKGSTYPVHPQGAAPRSAALAPSGEPRPLDSAIEFDAAAGSETLVTLFCAAPVAYGDIAPRLAKLANQAANHSAATPLPPVVDGCEQVVNRLSKRP